MDPVFIYVIIYDRVINGQSQKSQRSPLPPQAHVKWCDSIMQVWDKIWDVVPILNILDNIILIVDNKNVFIYLVWLVISRFIHEKPPTVEVFRLWLDFFFNLWMQQRAVPKAFYVEVQRPPKFEVLWSWLEFFSISQCTRYQCPTTSTWKFPWVLPWSGDLWESAASPEVNLTISSTRSVWVKKMLNKAKRCDRNIHVQDKYMNM